MRTVHTIVHRVAIDLVLERDVATHIAERCGFTVAEVSRLVVPIVAIASRSGHGHSARTCSSVRPRRNRRSLQPNGVALARHNRHAKLRDVRSMHHRRAFNLLPLLVIAHAKPTKRLARGGRSIQTDLTVVRESAVLWRGKPGKNEFAHARINRYVGTGVGQRHRAAIGGTNFTRAVVAHFAWTNNAIAAISFLAVVAFIRRRAVAVVALFTRILRAIATNVGLARTGETIGHATRAAAAARHTAAARHAAAARTHAPHTGRESAVRLARLYSHVHAITRALLRRIGHTTVNGIWISAAGLKNERRKGECKTRYEDFLEQATHG